MLGQNAAYIDKVDRGPAGLGILWLIFMQF